MSTAVCVVTGANSGIGKVMAREVARTGATVVMVCRNPDKGAAARDEILRVTGNQRIELLIADLGSIAQMHRVAEEVRRAHDHLHILINNAGAVLGRRIETEDGLETTFAVNHLAYFVVTHDLLPLLKDTPGARIISVSSGAHESARLDLDDLQLTNGYSPMRAYCNSKLMNLLFTYELARRLEGSGVTANAMHPGGVSTGFARQGGFLMKTAVGLARPFLLSPEQGADTGVYLALDEEVAGVSGKYFYKRKPVASSADSHNREWQARLWEISERLADSESVSQERSAS